MTKLRAVRRRVFGRGGFGLLVLTLIGIGIAPAAEGAATLTHSRLIGQNVDGSRLPLRMGRRIAPER